MKIRSMQAHRGALSALGQIHFHPKMNIIRGPNGIGKTTILEWVSLLGHIGLLPQDKSHSGMPELEMRIAFTSHDRAFIDWIRDPGLNREIRLFFKASLMKKGISPDIFDTAITIPNFLTIKLYLTDVSEKELKSILVNEDGMHKFVRFSISDLKFGEKSPHSENVEVSIGNILRALNTWSRPTQLPSEKDATKRYASTPFTFAKSKYNEQESAPYAAPVFFYLNTDMYEFGIGLDIRESPKDIKGNITKLLIERLQLISPLDFPLSDGPLTNAVPHNATLQLSKFDEIATSWNNIFRDHPLTEVTVKKVSGGDKEEDFDWDISISERRDGASFISSGENQALFVLAMLFGLASPGSCMLLDEPELHLSFWSGSRLVKIIKERCRSLDAQAIVVTHLPHLYRDSVNDSSHDDLWNEALDRADKLGQTDDSVGILYISIVDNKLSVAYDRKAIILAAKESHDDVMEVVDGLRLAQKIPIFPRFWSN